MKTKRIWWLTVLAAVSLFVSAGPYADSSLRVVRFEARAFHLRTGAHLYTEEHSEYWRAGRHVLSRVRYLSPQGRVIAQKRISFEKSRTAPEYSLEDHRTGYREVVNRLPDGRVRLLARRTRRDETKQRVVRLPEPAVVDGGFDYYIRTNWDSLSAGKISVVHFAVPVEQDYFRFRIERVGEAVVGQRGAVRFRFRVDSSLLNLFAESIEVDYDRETRRLLEYRGISNMNDDFGKSHRARIVFAPPGSKAR